MSSNAQRVAFEPLRSLAFGSISGSYTAIGGLFLNATRMIIIDNSTNANMTISFDGVNDHIFVPAISGRVLDYATNRVGPEDRLEQPVNTQVYVKQTAGAPTSGSVYVSVMFASGK